ncbi:short-chain dehydrogenase [Brachybacterium phenoliresistens]|uniref:Short-chain dehydrogenase n=1 Tax=Brachybacterium phenoliresistens TaxID=396014 RepID=Z9JQ05_9MICO|nr:SDR family oxidoreductase [Brachybacterium phenoliresistens]EWS80279.1 short-chain dehydrogenase [Brachybacterium phenoliresistens]
MTTPAPAAPSRPLVLVTGATRGIGRAVAQELAADHDLVLGGRDASALAELAASLEEAGGAAPQLLAADLTDAAQVARAVEELGLAAGLDGVVHSAGILVPGTVEDLAPEDWARSFATNVTAVAELTRLLLPGLRARRGTVVTINSGSGYTAGAGGGAYAASKFALRALTDALRQEERPHGVRVVSIHPGRVDSDMQRQLRSFEDGAYEVEKYLRPESVAATVGLALRLGEDAVIESLNVRPRG